MKKLAIFVEGQTEQIFIERLLLEVAGEKRISIEKRQARGGRCVRRSARLIRGTAVESGLEYFAMIVDCGADNRVGSDVRDQYDRLVATGYSGIVAIRDVAPEFSRGDIPELQRLLHFKMKTVPIRVAFILAIMEIEAWFLAEHTHFLEMDGRLTMAAVTARLGFDPSVDDVEQRDHPADDLGRAYALAGLGYHKSKTHVQRTVDALDYGRYYLELGGKLQSIGELVQTIDHFLS